MAAGLLRRVGYWMNGKETNEDFWGQETGKPYLVRQQRVQVDVFVAHSFEDVEEYASRLLDNEVIIVSLAKVDSLLRRRIFDYLNGVSYAIDAQVEKITDDVLLYAPGPVSVERDVRQPMRSSWFS